MPITFNPFMRSSIIEANPPAPRPITQASTLMDYFNYGSKIFELIFQIGLL